ncbi:hypothetical protein [Micromonospora sp. KC213]|uniref:hypothetical protein n=1 Tax=Micromonospora sp. KC213 TaxID=2530378 RepID=UPI00104A0D63|nr:hypothetical protein [Micromonospora sp. KC213]TDC43506.1 hypothetical protein E1166_03620 [Micromonospora sp. KC213]
MPSILATALLAAALTAAPTLASPAAVAPGALASYRVVDLGTFGGDSSYATAMNDRGDVVGRAQAADGTFRGFLWRDGRMIDLGAFNPIDVNDHGQVVGGHGDGSGGYVWHRGVLRSLGDPSALPVAINDRGQVVSRTAEGPVLWTNGRARPLPLAEVSDVNEHGQVSGGMHVPGGYHAALWHRNRVTDLGAGPFNRSNTYALNDHGWLIGWQFSAMQFPRGILWRHGRALDVGTLGGSFTELRAINNRGEILATSQATDGSARPALWRRGVLHDLSLAGVSTAGTVVDLDDHGRIAASIRPVWGVSRAVVYHPRSFEGSAAPRPTASGCTARWACR